MGVVKNLWGDVTNATTQLLQPHTPQGGLLGDMVKGSKQIVNTFSEPLAGRDAYGNVGTIFGHHMDEPQPPDPNAPGSIYNMGTPPTYAPVNMPAPGTPTNGLANGTMSGGMDWAPIIARALRKT